MTSQKRGKSALLAGASGLVGNELLHLLLEDDTYSQVTIFVRKKLPIEHTKLEQKIVDFDHLSKNADAFQVDDVFCCLGTTIKKAKSKEAFQKVDLEYPVELARLAKENGVPKFLIITAMGADAKSGIFYNQVKGQVEEAIRNLDLPSVHIFRPSLLLGDRQEFRLGEAIGAKVSAALSFAFVGGLRKYKPIQARTVAKAMYNVAQKAPVRTSVTVYESDKIANLGIATRIR